MHNRYHSVQAQVLSPLTRALLMADATGCVQIETDSYVLVRVLSPSQEVIALPPDLQAAINLAREEGANWLEISNMEAAPFEESTTIH